MLATKISNRLRTMTERASVENRTVRRWSEQIADLAITHFAIDSPGFVVCDTNSRWNCEVEQCSTRRTMHLVVVSFLQLIASQPPGRFGQGGRTLAVEFEIGAPAYRESWGYQPLRYCGKSVAANVFLSHLSIASSFMGFVVEAEPAERHRLQSFFRNERPPWHQMTSEFRDRSDYRHFPR
jgi:hypothetical protein